MSVNSFNPLPIDTSEALPGFDDTPVEAGDYEVRLASAEGATSQKGNPMVKWRFVVEDNGEAQGRSIFHTTVTVGPGSGMFLAVLSGLGFEPDEVISSWGNQVTPEGLASLVGETARVRVRVKQDEGYDPKAEIAKFYV